MGETQASHNWRGNGAFSKPRPFRDEAIDITVGYEELPGSPVKVDDENGLLDFLRDAVGDLHDGKGNWLTDEQALYILETSGVGSLYDMRVGLYSTDGKAISTKAELIG